MVFKKGDNFGVIPANFKDLTGQRFGQFVVLGIVGKNKSGTLFYKCKCDCGSIFIRSRIKITFKAKNPEIKSCGCASRFWRGGRSKEPGYMLFKRYGLTREDFLNLVELHNGKCGICMDNFIRLNVDHDHKTGQVRGLLCSKCNTLLGYARDSIKVLKGAIEYLEKNGTDALIENICGSGNSR